MHFTYTRASFALTLVALLSACGTQKPAPVVDRSTTPVSRPAPVTPGSAAAIPPAGGRDARDGVYTVQRGDTLFSIGLAFGIDTRELARINNITDPSQLTVGQILRVRPANDAAVATVTPVAPVGSTEVRPLPVPGAAPPASSTAPTPATMPPATKPAEITKPTPAESNLQWAWPAAGKVIEAFEDPRNKGIDIGGTEGEPIRVAADGKVVYVGSAVRGYGNLVIVEHADEFISAYAHNRQIVVKQGQQIKRGEKIAEMGKSDADRPKLHFEIRRQGKPLDPLRYLPPR